MNYIANLTGVLQKNPRSADRRIVSAELLTIVESGPGSSPRPCWVATYLEQAISEFPEDAKISGAIRKLAAEYPEDFFLAAAKLLKDGATSPALRMVAGAMLRDNSFFVRLTNPARRSCDNAVRLFRTLLSVDPTLDFRLARLLPGRSGGNPDGVLTGGHAVRALDILDKTSTGPRLLSVLGRLHHCDDGRLSAKAALVVGKHRDNPDWTAKQLLRDDPRLRANAIEAFWGARSEAAVRILEGCAESASHRVAGNALVGLHLAGRPGVAEKVLAMSRSGEPGRRAAAAWVMRRIGSPGFVARLAELMRDESPGVRSMAIRAMVEIGRVDIGRVDIGRVQAAPEPEVPAETVAEERTETAPETTARKPVRRVWDFSILKLDQTR